MLSYLKDLLPLEGAPKTLYRIYDTETFNKRRSGGFLAGDCTPFDMHDALAVHDAVENHLNWHNRSILTPFISTSDSSSWTRVNSSRREENGNGNVMIAEISTVLAADVPVYSMQTLADAVGISVKHPCDHEWVFVGRIPQRAIIAEYDVAEFEMNFPECFEGYSMQEFEFDNMQQEMEVREESDESDDCPSEIDCYFSDDDVKLLWELEENANHYSPWDDLEENTEEDNEGEDYVDEDSVDEDSAEVDYMAEYYGDEDYVDEELQAFILSQMGY
ncbi:hypothetical protein BDD12DRAFT_913938 [Trichophaea hybrida]|nr:hypothetical protein BDD12DRAFT_913938 [Trichophaea hybrida]